MRPNLIATRSQGLAVLQAFVPRMGHRYAAERNFDRGPGARDNVSVLSPYLRRRLVTEEEVVSAALSAHGCQEAEKLIEEVIWRGYFKGWLERRPQIWASYVQGLHADLSKLGGHDSRLRSDVVKAEAGETGLGCFDAWVRELVDTGYLHNHARMWFASIWIFTLGLPWRIGADFFYRHLLDGDAASNTLGWRWVAGLHTRGKAYCARSANIATFTNGRFTPRDGDLATTVRGLEDQEPEGLPPVLPLRAITPPRRGRPTALLITDEDCQVEHFDRAALDIQVCATLSASHLRSQRAVADSVVRFEESALVDAALRGGFRSASLRAGDLEGLLQWVAQAGAKQIVTPYITRGPLRDWLEAAAPALAAAGIELCEWRRDWDEHIWPHATAGFFKVKQQIPRIIASIASAESAAGAGR